MKEKPTGKTSDQGRTADWKRLQALSDTDIRSVARTDPEARPTGVDFWKQSKIVLPRAKPTVTIRLAAATERLSDANHRRTAHLHGSTEAVSCGQLRCGCGFMPFYA